MIRTKIMEVFGSGDEEVARKRFNKMVDAAFLANPFLFVSKRESEEYVWRRCVCGTSSERTLAFGCSFVVFSVLMCTSGAINGIYWCIDGYELCDELDPRR